MPMRPFDQIQGFVFVEALQRDRVDLDLESSSGGGLDSSQNDVQVAPAGHLAKFVRIQRIKRDVDALDAAIGEFRSEARQL